MGTHLCVICTGRVAGLSRGRINRC
jgi:hypothetical protein